MDQTARPRRTAPVALPLTRPDVTGQAALAETAPCGHRDGQAWVVVGTHDDGTERRALIPVGPRCGCDAAVGTGAAARCLAHAGSAPTRDVALRPRRRLRPR